MEEMLKILRKNGYDLEAERMFFITHAKKQEETIKLSIKFIKTSCKLETNHIWKLLYKYIGELYDSPMHNDKRRVLIASLLLAWEEIEKNG